MFQVILYVHGATHRNIAVIFMLIYYDGLKGGWDSLGDVGLD